MFQNHKTVWLSNTILLLTILLNALISTIAYTENQNLFWILIVSAPLLVITLFNSWQIKNLLRKYFIGRLQRFIPQAHFEWLVDSHYPHKIGEADLRVLIGNDQCSKPYNAYLLSTDVWENTNHGLSDQGFNMKEDVASGNIMLNSPNSPSDSSIGLIWEIDPSYRGCRAKNGNFDSLAFKRIARIPDVKMIQIDLNSFASPEYGVDSVLEFGKAIRSNGKPDLFTRSGYTTFYNAEGLVHFIQNLRNLSSGKPIGIRLSINDKKDFRRICHAVRKTQIIPDFISITGPSGKAAFNHSDFAFFPEMPIYEALLFVSQTLITYELSEDIKVIAVGKVNSGFDMLKMLALGANAVCIDSSCCNVPESVNRKEIRSSYWTNNIQYRIMKELVKIMNVGGFRNIKDVTLPKFLRRLDILQSDRYAQTEEQVSLKGSVKQMIYDKSNRLESLNRKLQENASLQ